MKSCLVILQLEFELRTSQEKCETGFATDYVEKQVSRIAQFETHLLKGYHICFALH